jgi:hypothetical protein
METLTALRGEALCSSPRKGCAAVRKTRGSRYGVLGGATRFFVACSNAYAISISTGSLHAAPVKPTP